MGKEFGLVKDVIHFEDNGNVVKLMAQVNIFGLMGISTKENSKIVLNMDKVLNNSTMVIFTVEVT